MNVIRNVGWTIAACWLTTCSVASAAKPNVLLLCVDDLKPVLGCYGDQHAKTPHLDSFAKRAVRFDRAYCNQAVCSPSRNALLTGLRPQTLGIYDLGTNFRKSRPDAVTLPQHFQQSGWRTEALGKIFHVGHGNTEDVASWSVPHLRGNVVAYGAAKSKAKSGLTREEALFANQPAKDLPKGAAYESADVPDNAYPDGAMADEAIVRLRAAKERSIPFFIALGFVKPHLPFVAPKKYWDLYDPATLPLAAYRDSPTGAPAYAPQSSGELRNYRDIPDRGALPEDLQRTLIHGYYAATSYTDAQIGRVLAVLRELGLAENTIVVLWGDHGWHLGDHGMWCKHTNYEQATRIPLMVAAPGAVSGGVCSGLVETVDVYPTLCELAGLDAPEGLEGKSFAANLRDPSAPSRDHAIHVYPRNAPGKGNVLGRAIRTERYRLVEWKGIGASAESADWELYDYETDPLERKNLAAEQPETVAKLREFLARHPEAKPQWNASAASSGSKPATKPASPPTQSREKLFARKDADSDGKLTLEEFLANQPDPDKAPARFKSFDRDGNGELSREEFVNQGKVTGKDR